MVISKSAIISSLVTTVAIIFTSPLKAFAIGALISPMPFYFFGYIVDKYPSKNAIIASLIVISFNYFGLTWWYGIVVAVVFGSIFDIWKKARTQT